MIKAAIFDLGNVLFELNFGKWRSEMSALLGDNFSEDMHCIHLYETGQISTEVFIKEVLKLAVHEKAGASDVILAWNALLKEMPPEPLRLLKQIRKNYKVYLLSNNNDLHCEWFYSHVKDKYGIRQFDREYFDFAYYSQRIGLSKPDPECYQKVLKDIGMSAEQVIYFDDQPNNIAAAARLGILSVQVDHPSDLASKVNMLI